MTDYSNVIDLERLERFKEKADEAYMSSELVSDSTDGPIYSAHAEGWSEQASTTGKNLWSEGDVSVTSRNKTITLPSVLSSGNYVISAGVTSSDTDASTCLILLQYTDETYGPTTTIARGERVSVALTAAKSFNKVIFYASNNSTNSENDSASFTDIQLELGSTATSYELYSGGAPSPSPDYPQEIKVARGRNLLSKAAASTTLNGITFTLNNDGSVTANGTASNTATFWNGNMTLEPGTYALSGCPSGGSASTYRLDIRTESDSVLATDTGSGVSISVSSEITVHYLIRIQSGLTVSSLTFKPQLELGSTPTPYVPYGHVGLEVQGRNLWGGEKLADDIVRIVPNSIKDANAKTIQYAASNIDNKNIFEGLFKESTQYTLFLSIKSGVANLKILYTDGSVTYIPNGETLIVTTLSGKTVQLITGHWNTGNTVLNYEQCGLFEGALTADGFEPYHHTTTPIPLPLKSDGERWAGGLPDGTADVLTINSAGKWEWENEMDEVEVDSTKLSSSFTPTLHPNVRHVVLNILAAKKLGAILSDMFVHYQGSFYGDASGNEACGIYEGNGSIRFNINPSRLSADSEDGVRAWMDANKPKFLYPLATPTTEHGYIDLPDVPEGATVTIPELENVDVKCFLSGASSVGDLAGDLSARTEDLYLRKDSASSTYATKATTDSIQDDLDDAEQAIADTVTLLTATNTKLESGLLLTGTSQFMSTWAQRKRAIAFELGPVMMPVGWQFTEPWADGSTQYNPTWNTMHHWKVDTETSTNIPAMTVAMDKCLPFDTPFSPQQAFLTAVTAIPAGTYNITWGTSWGTHVVNGKSYQWTLTKELPAGGQLVGFYGAPDQAPSNWRVYAYASATSNAILETCVVTEGTEGTNLGTVTFAGVSVPASGTPSVTTVGSLQFYGLNSLQRLAYGNGRYLHSPARLYLNSTGTNWWSPQTVFDRPPSYASHPGFLTGLDPEFVDAMLPSKVVTALNYVTDGGTAGAPATDITYDKVYLPSWGQHYLLPSQYYGSTTENLEGEPWDYWKVIAGKKTALPASTWGNTATYHPEFIQYDLASPTTPRLCWMRSASRGTGTNVAYVYSQGYCGSNAAVTGYRLVPACDIGEELGA